MLAFASLANLSQNRIASIAIDYPNNDSVFPPDMAAPTFLWRDPAPESASWRIEVSFADGSAAIRPIPGNPTPPRGRR
jgi:hypothetical protein